MSLVRYSFVGIAMLIFIISSCSPNSNLELRTKYSSQDLIQSTEIGTGIGSVPPDFIVVTTDGKAVRLSEFAERKKPVIVYFMATWCPFCAEDYRKLSKVYSRYESNVTVLSISLDLSEDLNILREYKKKYPELESTMFAAGQPKILSDYLVTKTTTKYAIGKNGTVVYAGFGVFDEGQWSRLLEKLSE